MSDVFKNLSGMIVLAGAGKMGGAMLSGWLARGLKPSQRFRSIDDLVRRVVLRRDEIAMLAEIGALNSLGHDRRSAMWQIERAIRPAGELYPLTEDDPGGRDFSPGSPLDEMNISERLIADYSGTGLTVGPHPLTFRRREFRAVVILVCVVVPEPVLARFERPDDRMPGGTPVRRCMARQRVVAAADVAARGAAAKVHPPPAVLIALHRFWRHPRTSL